MCLVWWDLPQWIHQQLVTLMTDDPFLTENAVFHRCSSWLAGPCHDPEQAPYYEFVNVLIPLNWSRQSAFQVSLVQARLLLTWQIQCSKYYEQ